MANPTKNFAPSEFVCPHCGQGVDVIKQELLDALQRLRELWGKPMQVTSGYRCEAHNKAIGGALKSAHVEGKAADIADPDGALKRFCTEDVLRKVGIWREADKDTGGSGGGWLHAQVRPVPVRIFSK